MTGQDVAQRLRVVKAANSSIAMIGKLSDTTKIHPIPANAPSCAGRPSVSVNSLMYPEMPPNAA